MRPLSRDDIVDIAQYELERTAFRERIIALKRDRRVAVGDVVTLILENRDTMRFQVQEMMRVERIVREERIQEEIDTYNELVPGDTDIKATLLIEVTVQEEVKPTLDRFRGIDRGGTTYLLIGDERVEAEFEGGRSNEVKLSAVHYVTFALSPSQVEAIRSGAAPLSLLVDHPSANYRHETALSDALRTQLAVELAGQA